MVAYWYSRSHWHALFDYRWSTVGLTVKRGNIMAGRDKIEDRTFPARDTEGYSLRSHDDGSISGSVRTRFGFVRVNAYTGWQSVVFPEKTRNPRLMLDIIMNGTEHSRVITRSHFDRDWTLRGCATVAGRFAREIGTRELRDALD